MVNDCNISPSGCSTCVIPSLGTCVRASDDPEAECSHDGGYRPLQCTRGVNGDLHCRCVYPDGTQALANTTEPDEIPDCDDIGG